MKAQLFCISVALIVTATVAAQPQRLGAVELRSHEGSTCPNSMALEMAIDASHVYASTLLKEIAPTLVGYTCGGTDGWRRVVHLDMRELNTTCPSGWNTTQHSERGCGRASTDTGCDSVTFSVSGGEYSRVCGRIRAYQYDLTDGFAGYNYHGQISINSAYMSGVSVTYDSPRQHIWTFVAASSWYFSSRGDVCPCDAHIDIAIPEFVGEDYFCASGAHTSDWTGFHSNDPLWDGEDCPTRRSCCTLNDPPYFTKQLLSPTSAAIEARICEWGSDGDTPIELIEFYVQ